ncbi:efflux RND transporter periplasmic adaptor subunit [Rhizobium puerariae]|uniref:Efflux RND transporter periplasmic adaptor subunit n=1 Tax=Rhizobium puerariae TaxID=1585791 RepID=A0ABV6ADS7_9HYPH
MERPDMPRNTPSGFLRCVVLVASLATIPATVYAQQQPVPSVTVESVMLKDFTLKARLPGRIKASNVAEVRPQVSGIILERLFEEGARVKEGQPLYKIDDKTYIAAVASAQASVAQARADYDLAVIQARRAEDLFTKQTGSESNRDNAIATRDKADATLQMAKAQLTSAEINLERTTIRASLTGVIGLSQTTAGALVSAEQATALTTIRALDPIYVDVTQSATDLLRWNASGGAAAFGAAGTASMILPDGTTYLHKGELKAAEPQVVPTTGMVTLRITFANPDHMLLPGLYVEVELPQAIAKNAILVPQNAVMRNTKGEAYAWVVEDEKVAVRPLTILTNSGNTWVTTAGLKAGDKVITSGFQKIAPGATVKIEQAPAKEQAAVSGSN